MNSLFRFMIKIKWSLRDIKKEKGLILISSGVTLYILGLCVLTEIDKSNYILNALIENFVKSREWNFMLYCIGIIPILIGSVFFVLGVSLYIIEVARVLSSYIKDKLKRIEEEVMEELRCRR